MGKDPKKNNALQLEDLSVQRPNLVQEDDEGETKEDASMYWYDDTALFLTRYESMMDSQTLEEEATISHLKPLWQALHTLSSVSPSSPSTTNNQNHYSDALTQDALKQAYTQLLFFLQNKNEGDGGNETTNDNVDSMNQMCTWMACDAQFMLLLPTLLLEESSTNSNKISTTTDLTFYEFVHAYKTVIGGMQTLQRIPPTTVQMNTNNSAVQTSSSSSSPRTRATHRTLDMLKLFTSPAASTTEDETKLLEESPEELEESPQEEDMTQNVATTSSSSSRSRWMVVGLILLFLVDVLFGSFTYSWYLQQTGAAAFSVASDRHDSYHPSLEQLEGQASMLEHKWVASKAAYGALQQKHAVQTEALSHMEGQMMEQSRQVRSNKAKRLAMEQTEEQLTQKLAQALEQHVNLQDQWTTCQSELVQSHNQQILRTRYVSSTSLPPPPPKSPLLIGLYVPNANKSKSPPSQNNDFSRRRRQRQTMQDAKARLSLDPMLQRTVQRKTWLATLAGAVGAWAAPAVLNGLLSVTVAPIPALVGGAATLGLVIW
eukprot:CAMPEP_0198302160 /NCGR_PEP_ID=MMETSP1449-20131203/54180_1 /TAXON_ID=420275 /ORGANISM="Attheya septentrionalis, Strain CCMP2084" /LENGTH=543 /DNA_ID=CAMNT_0044004433 /DNA_START=25 /DNA_END=1653 /DNA_ORIENTATION=+